MTHTHIYIYVCIITVYTYKRCIIHDKDDSEFLHLQVQLRQVVEPLKRGPAE